MAWSLHGHAQYRGSGYSGRACRRRVAFRQAWRPCQHARAQKQETCQMWRVVVVGSGVVRRIDVGLLQWRRATGVGPDASREGERGPGERGSSETRLGGIFHGYCLRLRLLLRLHLHLLNMKCCRASLRGGDAMPSVRGLDSLPLTASAASSARRCALRPRWTPGHPFAHDSVCWAELGVLAASRPRTWGRA